MNANNKVLYSLLLGCIVYLPANAAAELRLGVVNPVKILESAPQAEAARKRLEQEFASRDRQLVSLQRTLKQKEDRLAKDGAVMSESERQKLERDIISARRDLRRDQTDFRDDLNLRRNEELGKLQRQVAETIRTVAKDQNFDVIVGEGVYYASERVDITDEVVKRLKAQR
ncbi:MAG: OmpH family outer membrane protein [Gammaproteobacteria bacterium]